MNSDDRLADLFDRALALAPADRLRFLEVECAGEVDLLRRLCELLDADRAATGNPAWARPVLVSVAQIVAELPDHEIGEQVGPYRLVQRIGAGGMGKVYRAVRSDDQYQKSVAIKRIQRGLDAAQIVRRFRAERQILANLEHECIARLLDGGADQQGLPYLVMEYVDGHQPAEYCEQRKLDLRARLSLFRQICSAVHFAHQRMVIHRDLKPGNILVTAEGVPKLLDFGIAKVFGADPLASGEPNTQTAALMMTPRYASPEQVRGEAVTTATDIYSLGVILYELLTGRSAYRAPDSPTHELMRAVCEEEPPRPSAWRKELRGDLDNIILKALRKEAGQRYSSVHEMSHDVQRHLDGLPVLARGDSFPYLAGKFVRRYKVPVAAAALAASLAVVGMFAILRARARAEHRFNQVRQLAHSVVFDYHDAIENLPGSTPVRERLVQDALKYLDSLASEDAGADLQREIVDAYVRIAHVQGDANFNNLGDTAGALRSAAKAVEAAEKLLAGGDRSPETLTSAANAFITRGSLLHSAGDLSAAERVLKRAVELREAAASAVPQDLEIALAVPASWRFLADLYGGAGMQNLGRTNEARELYRRAAEWAARLAQQHPADVRPLKERRSAAMMLAGVESSLGRTADADRHLAEALQLGEAVVRRQPEDTIQQLELANACLRIGMRRIDVAQPQSAIAPMQRAEEILEKLLAADPRNALYQRDLSVTESQLAAALRATGAFDEALARNRRSLALAVGLRQSDPQSVEHQADEGISRRKLAETLLAAGQARASVEEGLRAVNLLCPAASSSPDAYLQAHCDRARLAAAEAELRVGDARAAEAAFRLAGQTALRIAAADPGNMALLSDLARAESGLAEACLQLQRRAEAGDWLRRALGHWSDLRNRHGLSFEESAYAAAAARDLRRVAGSTPRSR